MNYFLQPLGVSDFIHVNRQSFIGLPCKDTLAGFI